MNAAAQNATEPVKDQIERELRAQLAAVTGGLAPEDYSKAFWDWYLGLAAAPDQQAKIAQSAVQTFSDSWNYAARAMLGDAPPPVPGNTGFANPAWNQWPFNVMAHSYNNWSKWWTAAFTAAPGLNSQSAQTIEFMARQVSEAASPANYLATNPEVLEATRAESGQNLVRGVQNWVDDITRLLQGDGPVGTENFKPGVTLALTPGKVIYRNELIELIQYSPQSPDVYAEPVLIVPAWIMKYYILDLSPANSLVRFLVEKGHTVFMISWKNPDASDRDRGMDDYLRAGVGAAIDAVSSIVPNTPIQSVGYCIGGTLLAIAAARLAARGDRRLSSMTLLAAQTDFSEPGELSLFITPAQLETLQSVMEQKGVLESKQMGAAFTLLRSRDLIWNPAVKTYLQGKRDSLNDLMAWNADGTRMPCRMHSEYLYKLYLHNEFANGRYVAEGQACDPASIIVPMFVVGTETDHVAPWKSVYKSRALTRSSDYTFLLTSGGHNAGIISGPVHPRRRHRVLTWHDADTQLAPDQWLASVPAQDGSWWPVWERWLAAHASAQRLTPPAMGNAAAGYGVIEDAPGRFVNMR